MGSLSPPMRSFLPFPTYLSTRPCYAMLSSYRHSGLRDVLRPGLRSSAVQVFPGRGALLCTTQSGSL